MSDLVKRITGRAVKEGMDDADDGSPMHVSGPSAATNEAAEWADAVENAAQRVSGFILRTPNANNPKMAATLKRIHRELSDMAAQIEGVQ